jgi:hypothetical protein
MLSRTPDHLCTKDTWVWKPKMLSRTPDHLCTKDTWVLDT